MKNKTNDGSKGYVVSYKVIIDGKDYNLRKLKFGKQVELAEIVSSLFEDSGLSTANLNSRDFNLASLLTKSPKILLRVIALALDTSIEEVSEMENMEDMLKNLDKFLEMNNVGTILGKSGALLNSIV